MRCKSHLPGNTEKHPYLLLTTRLSGFGGWKGLLQVGSKCQPLELSAHVGVQRYRLSLWHNLPQSPTLETAFGQCERHRVSCEAWHAKGEGSWQLEDNIPAKYVGWKHGGACRVRAEEVWQRVLKMQHPASWIVSKAP